MIIDDGKSLGITALGLFRGVKGGTYTGSADLDNFSAKSANPDFFKVKSDFTKGFGRK